MNTSTKASTSSAIAGPSSQVTPVAKDILIGTLLGSAGSNTENENVVGAFIDASDALRFVVHNRNTRGEIIKCPLPSSQQALGALLKAGIIRWYQHLQHLKTIERKEYVRIRHKYDSGSTGEPSNTDDFKAVRDAQSSVHLAQDPDHTPQNRINTRVSLVPRTGNEGEVLLGYWSKSKPNSNIDSEEQRPEDKHAVVGIIYHNFQSHPYLRCAVVRRTRDGRPANGNFPSHGGVWIKFDDVVFEPQLVGKTRLEIQEYVEQELQKHSIPSAATPIPQISVEEPTTSFHARRNAKRPARESDSSYRPPGKRTRTEKGKEKQAEERSPSPPMKRSRWSSTNDIIDLTTVNDESGSGSDEENITVYHPANERTSMSTGSLNPTTGSNLITSSSAHAAASIPAPQPLSPKVSPSQALHLGNKPAEVQIIQGVRYVRKQAGIFKGKLVAPLEELSFEGKEYISYQVLIQQVE